MIQALLTLIVCFSSFSSYALCQHEYQKLIQKNKIYLFNSKGKKGLNPEKKGDAKFNETYITLTGLSASTSLPIGILAALGFTTVLSAPVIVVMITAPILVAMTPLIYNQVATHPYRKMLKLIDQAYLYQENGYRRPKHLLKMSFEKIQSPSISLQQFADAITEGNENGKLCEHFKNYQSLKNFLSQETIHQLSL